LRAGRQLVGKDSGGVTRPQWKVAIALLAVYVCWGATYLAMRIAVVEIPPHLMAAFRFLIAGVLLYAWVRYRGVKPPTLIQWRSAFVVGAFLLVAANASVAWAEQRVPSGLTALLVASVPLWMVGMDWGRGGGRPASQVIAGLALGIFGVGLLVAPSLVGHAQTIDRVGAVILILASASWAWGSIYSKSAPLPESPFMATAQEMIAGGVLLLLTAAIAGQFHGFRPSHVSVRAWVSLLYLIVFGSLIGFTAYIWLLNSTSVARAGTYAYVNPVVAVILGWAVLAEPITTLTIVAALVIVVAVALVNSAKSPTTSSSGTRPTPEREHKPRQRSAKV
jgi:drug/metabolite transporter (DMT)-like permease